MKLHDIIYLINTDEFTICKGEKIEEIRGYEKGSFAAIRKYFDDEVEKIVPTHNAVEIYLK